MLTFFLAALLSTATSVSAQGYGGYGGYGNPYDGSSGGPGNGPFSNANYNSFIADRQKIVIAHGVLAAAAFVFFFPVGAILIRLGNFRGSWLVHAAIQAFSYLLFIAAFGIGVYIARNLRLLDQAHPIIGIILFILIFFQPFLGLAHHVMFKKHSRRVVWSYGHIWLGRIIITLGIINGGLGLQLAQRTRIFAPSTGAIIGYSVVAGVMWLIYVVAIIIGESRRSSRQSKGVSSRSTYSNKPAYNGNTANQHDHVYA